MHPSLYDEKLMFPDFWIEKITYKSSFYIVTFGKILRTMIMIFHIYIYIYIYIYICVYVMLLGRNLSHKNTSQWISNT